ncbi:MAG: LTA synthase family protein [Prevotellaceae bacterium]|jgi:arylsulfatase A-like enzyme|nr:LTA synthase family protein [Prevotellaceae bacterium]
MIAPHTLRFRGNVYFVLTLHLLQVMLFFSLCRVLFYLFNTEIFPDMNLNRFLGLMRGGLKFDLSATLYTNALFIAGNALPFYIRHRQAYQVAMKWIFALCNGAALATNCIDMAYYRFTMRRTTWAVFDEFAGDATNFPLFAHLLVDYWYLLLVWLAMVAALMWLYSRVKVSPHPFSSSKLVYYISSSIAFLLIITLFVGGVRGGFEHSTRPITISNAAAYTDKPAETGIVLNTPFSIYRTIKRVSYDRFNYFSDKEIESIYSPLHFPSDTLVFKPKNVVIFILESMSKEYTGAANQHIKGKNYQSFTPFLDSLVESSYSFRHSFANGMKSIDAMPSILASIPSLTEPYILSIYSNNTVKGLAALLAEKGYDCSFFHGAPNGSMGFDAFARMSGFQHYYGKREYANDKDFDGIWGIRDEPFFQYFARTLDKKPEPFFATLFSLSSHHPFELPDEYKGKFPEGSHPIHKCIGYTDMSLRKFFEAASQTSWYHNTLFVLVADHTNHLERPESLTSVGVFSVPIILFDPSGELVGCDENRPVQQIDLMPTVLGYLNYDKPYLAFGFDALQDYQNQNSFTVNCINGIYQVFDGKLVLLTRDREPVALYDYENDPLLTKNLDKDLPQEVERLTRKFRAFIQQYNKRLIDNEMTFFDKENHSPEQP